MRVKNTWLMLLVMVLILSGPLPAFSFKKYPLLKAPSKPFAVESDTFVRLYEHTNKSVVRIIAETEGDDKNSGKRGGFGSGFVWTNDGLILTNAHVVGNATKVRVYVTERQRYEATVVGKDDKMDVALLKIGGVPNFVPAKMGNSDNLKTGDMIYALGHPLGFNGTMTAGIISGLHRQINDNVIIDMIQIDAALNPGNSGGPLSNTKGEVIGMNLAVISEANSIGFAIPINDVLFVARELRDKGEISYGYLGASITDVFRIEDEEMARSIGLSWPLSVNDDVVVARVSENTPASAVGLRMGDIIKSFNGVLINDMMQFVKLVSRSLVGSKVSLVIRRDGQDLTLEPVLAKRPAEKVLKNTSQEDIEIEIEYEDDGNTPVP